MNFKEIVESTIKDNELHEGFLNKAAYQAKVVGMRLSHSLTKQRFLTNFNSKSGKEHLDAAADELDLDHRLQPSAEALKHLASTIISNPNADYIHLNSARRHMSSQDDVINFLNHPNSSNIINNNTKLYGIFNKKDENYEENLKAIGHHPKLPIDSKLSILDHFKRYGNKSVTNSIGEQIINNDITTAEQLNNVLSNKDHASVSPELALKALTHKNANSDTITSAAFIHRNTDGINTDLEKELEKHINHNYHALSSISSTTKNPKIINKLSDIPSAHQGLSVNPNMTDEHLSNLIHKVKTSKESGWRRSSTMENIMSHKNKGEQTINSIARHDYWAADDLLDNKNTTPSVLRTIYDNHVSLRNKALNHPNGSGLRNFGLPIR